MHFKHYLLGFSSVLLIINAGLALTFIFNRQSINEWAIAIIAKNQPMVLYVTLLIYMPFFVFILLSMLIFFLSGRSDLK